MFTPRLGLVKPTIAAWDRPQLRRKPPFVRRATRAPGLSIEDRPRRRLVGDEAVDQASSQRGADRRNLGLPDRGCDRRRLRRQLRRNAGEPPVGATLDEPPLGVIGPP